MDTYPLEEADLRLVGADLRLIEGVVRQKAVRRSSATASVASSRGYKTILAM
jgi:hypothetical protein